MKLIIVILIILLMAKGCVYKRAFLIMGHFIKEKKHIVPTDEELKECADYVTKHEWFKWLF